MTSPRPRPSDYKLELLELDTNVCSHCNPKSPVPHEIKKTRLRITNLCCSGEERIIRSVLQDISGIEEISINVIGRYAVIKHCNVQCCAPIERIVHLLNEKQLGASVQEANTNEDEKNDEPEWASIAHGVVVILLFLSAAIFDLTTSSSLDGGSSPYIAYISCTAIGLVPILYDAFISLSRLSIDIHILMIVAVAGAIASQEYQDAALVVTLFILAELIESEVMRRVRNAVKLGVGGMPKSAILLNGDVVLVDDLKVGDTIAVRAGDMILADGEVTNGTGVVDESALTGEAIPISKTKGDKVISGTVIQNGYLEILVETDPKQSTVRKLNEKVAEVQTDRGRFASLVDQFAGIWTPLILLAAVALTCIAGGATGEWHRWSHRSLVLLVLACPCAIVIAAPIPSVCTIATAARHGVLIKGSSVVENLAVVDKLATDKTGTLTKGYFSVTASLDLSDVDNEGDEDSEDLNPIALAAALESRSAHPLANAIVSCTPNHLPLLPDILSSPFSSLCPLQIIVVVSQSSKAVLQR
jgi:Zn2+/Cd2+-exporting ATPase